MLNPRLLIPVLVLLVLVVIYLLNGIKRVRIIFKSGHAEVFWFKDITVKTATEDGHIIGMQWAYSRITRKRLLDVQLNEIAAVTFNRLLY